MGNTENLGTVVYPGSGFCGSIVLQDIAVLVEKSNTLFSQKLHNSIIMPPF